MKKMKKIKRDIISAWNEIEEVALDLKELDDKGLKECRSIMLERLQLAMDLLGEYFSDDEAQVI